MWVILAQRLHPCTQTRHFSGSGVLVKHSLRHTAHQLGLSGAQCRSCGIFVTRRDGFFHFAKLSTDARTAGFVDGKALFVLTCALFGLRRICHDCGPFLWGRLNSWCMQHTDQTQGIPSPILAKRAARACMMGRYSQDRAQCKCFPARRRTSQVWRVLMDLKQNRQQRQLRIVRDRCSTATPRERQGCLCHSPAHQVFWRYME